MSGNWIEQMDCLIRDNAAFKDLVPKVAAIAVEKGHRCLGNIHWFAALLRDPKAVPWIPTSLATRWEEELWQVVRAREPVPMITEVVHDLFYMFNASAADAYFLGSLQPQIRHTFLFFLTRPNCAASAVFDRQGVDRKDLIVKVAEDTEKDKADVFVNYYMRIHEALVATKAEQKRYARRLGPSDFKTEP